MACKPESNTDMLFFAKCLSKTYIMLVNLKILINLQHLACEEISFLKSPALQKNYWNVKQVDNKYFVINRILNGNKSHVGVNNKWLQNILFCK